MTINLSAFSQSTFQGTQGLQGILGTTGSQGL
jgi:hypothetical protein